MFIYRNQTELNPQYIINFPTKNHWLNESRFQDIVAGLEALKLVLQEYYISSVAIPALGCGLGGLEWSEGFQFIGFPSEWGAGWMSWCKSGCKVSNLLGFPASGESTLLKPAWIGNGKGHLRASPKIVIHCTVSDPEKSPQTPSGSHIEHLHEKMGISRFWLDSRIITEPSSSDRNRVTLLDVGRCPRSVTGGGYAGVESLIKVVENRIVQ
jgi:hypothetical protein